LKTFTSAYDHLFENEKNAFIGLRGHQGMIKYLGWFKHDFVYPNTSATNSNPSTLDTTNPDQMPQEVGPSILVNGNKQESIKTSNILLQHGLLDLEEYFCNRCPPPLQKEILSFWKNVFEIASQVSALHNLEMKERRTVKKYNGSVEIFAENLCQRILTSLVGMPISSQIIFFLSKRSLWKRVLLRRV
jgi:hypothetical protein